MTQVQISTEDEAKVLNDLLVRWGYITSGSEVGPISAFKCGYRVAHFNEVRKSYEGASFGIRWCEDGERYTFEEFLLSKGIKTLDKIKPKPVVMLRLSCGGSIVDDGNDIIITKDGARVSVGKEEMEALLAHNPKIRR